MNKLKKILKIQKEIKEEKMFLKSIPDIIPVSQSCKLRIKQLKKQQSNLLKGQDHV